MSRPTLYGKAQTNAERQARWYWRRRASEALGQKATDLDVRAWLLAVIQGEKFPGERAAPGYDERLTAARVLLTHFPDERRRAFAYCKACCQNLQDVVHCFQ